MLNLRKIIFLLIPLLPTILITIPKTSPQYDALRYAIYDSETNTVKKLIQKGADINETDESLRSILHCATSNRAPLEIIKILVENGANVNAQDKFGSTPLHHAVDRCCGPAILEVLKFLIKNGADINAKNSIQNSPLIEAIKTGCSFIVIKFLVENNADVNAKSGLWTVLDLAVNECDERLTALLVDHGAEIKPSSGYPYHQKKMASDIELLLKYAKEKTSHFEEELKKLIATGGNINEKDEYGNTRLFYHTINDIGGYKEKDIEKIKLLLKYGANPNIGSSHGNTPLHNAAHELLTSEKLDVLKILIENGANVNAKNNVMKTPLFYAIDSFSNDGISFLIENGADVNVKDKFGQTLLHEAIEKTFEPKIIDLLLKYGTNKNVQNNNNETPLVLAKNKLSQGLTEGGFFWGIDTLGEIIRILESGNPSLPNG